MAMKSSLTRHRAWTRAACAAALAAGTVVGGATSAAAAPAPSAPGGSFSLVDSSYILTMRSSAIEPYATLPRDLPMGIGHSFVDLVHDMGRPQGRCEVIGAGYWLGTELEEAVLGPGLAPPDPTTGKAAKGYENPTISRNVAPNISPTDENLLDKNPAIPADGSGGPHWKAKCQSDTSGTGTGIITSLPGVAGLVGSTTTADVNKQTGTYVGTGRAYIADLKTPLGNFDSVTSVMQVKNEPNKKPTVTYRVSFAGGNGTGTNFALAQDGFSIAGTDVPVDDLVKQYNDQVTAQSKNLATLGTFGLWILAPQVGKSVDGGRYSISAPVVLGRTGLEARSGTVGHDQGMRLGSTTFTGVYGFDG
jgi:hypothetical protein